MKKKFFWSVVSVVVVGSAVVFANLTPQQTLLTQCSDQIFNRNVCVYRGITQRYCCIPYPVSQWRKAWCQTVELYVQYRQPPLPPSVYFANRRNCSYTGEICSPMTILKCPTP